MTIFTVTEQPLRNQLTCELTVSFLFGTIICNHQDQLPPRPSNSCKSLTTISFLLKNHLHYHVPPPPACLSLLSLSTQRCSGAIFAFISFIILKFNYPQKQVNSVISFEKSLLISINPSPQLPPTPKPKPK